MWPALLHYYSVYFIFLCFLILRWMYLVLLKLRKWIYLNGFFVMTWKMSRIVREKMQPSMKLIVQIHTFCLFIILKSGKGLYKRLVFHIIRSLEFMKYVVKNKSAKLFITYALGKLEAALNISHLILSTSSQRVS